MNKGKILVVDDNKGICAALKILLPPHFEEVLVMTSPATLVSEMESFKPDVVLLDMNFFAETNSGNEGLFWTTEIKKMMPKTEVVLFTAYADIALAVEGMRRGAFDFIVKPWDNEKLISVLKNACCKACKSSIKDTFSDDKVEMFWGGTPAMQTIRHNVGKIAPTDATVLITGENGTGKDVLAQEIHRLSNRCKRQIVCVDAGAITETLFESELFGHVKGAFTDAHTDHIGKFEQADGGTLFLDEIGNIPLHLQAKLLRAIQNRNITKVGDNKLVPVDIRLICATNKNLEKMVAEGHFREDLYYRINTVQLHLPSLRDRKNDILPLAEIFIRKFNKKYRRNIEGVSESGREVLENHSWSGNIRELQNCIEKAVILAENIFLTPNDLKITSVSKPMEIPTLDETEEKAIRSAMEKYDGNLTLVAKSLNISRPTLYNKLRKYGI